MKGPIENKIITLYRKIISSLVCIEKRSKDNVIADKANIYLNDFINQYELYRNKKNINNFKFSYNLEDIINFCNECYSKVEIFDFAEDVEYGIKELLEVINKK